MVYPPSYRSLVVLGTFVCGWAPVPVEQDSEELVAGFVGDIQHKHRLEVDNCGRQELEHNAELLVVQSKSPGSVEVDSAEPVEVAASVVAGSAGLVVVVSVVVQLAGLTGQLCLVGYRPVWLEAGLGN